MTQPGRSPTTRTPPSLVAVTPTKLRINDINETERAAPLEALSYVDNKVDYALRKLKSGSVWFIRNQGRAAYTARLADLQRERDKCLLLKDENGYWTYTGNAKLVADTIDTPPPRIGYAMPEPKLIPWAKVPEKKLRKYQEDMVAALLAAAPNGPAAVEVGTGLGKSLAIMYLVKQLGLQTVVMAPSASIAGQLYNDFVEHFGKAKVGMYGDGKKEFKKQFTIAIGASLTRVAEGSPIWNTLSTAKVFIADESHQTPAATLAKVCFGLLASAPYRFFFSGTQLRGDGLDLVLGGITGPIVYTMSVQDGVDQGFLAKPVFRMVWMKSTVECESDDVNDLTRAHVYYNEAVNKAAAMFANKAVAVMGRPTLILIDELEQFSKLLPYLGYDVRFAHGGVTADNKQFVPEKYHDSNPDQFVEEFNDGKFPILVGTSCIATGTDIKVAAAIIYLRGGKSEVEVRQGAVGRGTRLVPGKEDVIVIDFGILNVEPLKRHAEARRAIYKSVYPSYSEITL